MCGVCVCVCVCVCVLKAEIFSSLVPDEQGAVWDASPSTPRCAISMGKAKYPGITTGRLHNTIPCVFGLYHSSLRGTSEWKQHMDGWMDGVCVCVCVCVCVWYVHILHARSCT